jgi:hypothetical protein
MKTYLLPPTIVAFAFLSFNVSATTHYVDLTCTNPVSPYTDWSTAATKIQDAVRAATAGDQIVVANGTYGPVSTTQPVALQSVNGPALTFINGGGVAGCVNLASGASLTGFTLTNGSADSGGGVNCASASATVSNCVLTGNTATEGGGAYSGTLINCVISSNLASVYGGGAFSSTLTNCTLSGNTAASNGGGAYSGTLINCVLSSNMASVYGGGAYASVLSQCVLTGNSAGGGGGGGADQSTLNDCALTANSTSGSGGGVINNCTLNNCTLTGNSAAQTGGGADSSTLNNCIVYYNSAPAGTNYSDSTLNYCCTTPLPGSGSGNIANAPLFVNTAGGNLRLQSNSPCINAGDNSYVAITNDLDGNPRIKGGTVDVGAYEFQTPSSVLSYAWAQQYGLPTDGTADYTDPDGDGMNNYQECKAGTNPTNALSVLKMLSATPTNNPPGIVVTWQSVNTRTYFLQSSTNLLAQSAFSTIQSNIVGQTGITSYTDTNAVGVGPYFYRVGVQ